MGTSSTETGEFTASRPAFSQGARNLVARYWAPLTLLLLLLGAALAFVAYRVTLAYERERAMVAFDEYAAEQANLLENEARAYVEGLHSLRGFYRASREVERGEFRVFARQVCGRYPAIRAIEWVPRVSASEREHHEQAVRDALDRAYRITEAAADGRLVPARRRYVHYPVLFVEPAEGNELALGYDIFSEARRRAAANRAIGTGQAVMSDPLGLVQDEEASPGFVVLLAVYGRGAEGTARIRLPVAGLVLVAFRSEDLVREALLSRWGGRPAWMDFQLEDPETDTGTEVIFAHGRTRDGEDASEAVVRRIQFAGQAWSLRAWPTPAFLLRNRSRGPLLVGLVVLLGWLLVTGLLAYVIRRGQSAALRRQAGLVRSVLRNLEEGVVVADESGKIQLANRSALQMLGASLRQMVPGGGASHVAEHLLPDGVTPFPPEEYPLRRAIAGEAVSEERILVRRQRGEKVWLSASGRPLLGEDGVAHGGVTILRDVTRRKAYEDELRQLSNAVEQTADAVLIADRKGKVLYVNPAFERTSGYTRAEVIGRTPRMLRSGEHGPEFYAKLWSTILGGNVFRATVVNRRKNGELFYAEQTITPMKDDRGRITTFVSVSKDMTEARRIQEQEVEMSLAAQVQEKLYPPEPPRVRGFDVAGSVFPAEATCGDYYDYLPFDGDTLALAVGDVCGHGIGPAMVMAETRAYVRSLVGLPVDLAEMMTRTNDFLSADLVDHLFVTLIAVQVDLDTRRITHASAGHTPGLLVGADGEVKAELNSTGLPLGMFPGSAYEARVGPAFEEGDVLVLLTDGVTESRGDDGAFFGTEGLLEVVRARLDASAEEIVAGVRESIRAFTGEDRPRDDVTVVVCKCRGCADDGPDA